MKIMIDNLSSIKQLQKVRKQFFKGWDILISNEEDILRGNVSKAIDKLESFLIKEHGDQSKN